MKNIEELIYLESDNGFFGGGIPVLSDEEVEYEYDQSDEEEEDDDDYEE